MTYELEHNLDPLCGRVVYVDWRDDNEESWHIFRILDIHPVLRMILLEGLPENGCSFDGGPVWICVEELESMELLNLDHELTILESKFLSIEEINEIKDENKENEIVLKLIDEINRLKKILFITKVDKIKEVELEISEGKDEEYEDDDDEEWVQ